MNDDVYVQFKFDIHYDKNRIVVKLMEFKKTSADKWAAARVVGKRSVKIKGWFVSEETLGNRLQEIQSRMIQEYKKKAKYYDAVDEYVRLAEYYKISVKDARTSDFINKFR